MMTTELIQERVRFAGSRGALSGELMYGLDAGRCGVLLVGPHPYMGGSMENILLRHVAQALAEAGCVVLRFDYSGTGDSEGAGINVQDAMARFWATGQAPQDEALLDDARCAARWLEAACRLPQVVIGYSFGAYAAIRAITATTMGLMLVAPTLKQHRLVLPAGATFRCKLIEAGRDFATPAEVTQRWIQGVNRELNVEKFADADHFFRGMEAEVARCCAEFCTDLTEDIAR